MAWSFGPGNIRARRERRTAARSRILLEATAALADSSNYQDALRRVAALAVPVLADRCRIDVADEDGALVGVASAPEDEATISDRPVSELPASRRGGPGIVGRGVVTIESGRHGTRVRLRVPLVARGQSLGYFTLLRGPVRTTFDAEDVAIAEDLALRASATIDAAQLYLTAERERQKLAEANRIKDDFLAMLSHELRTPLNAILGWTRVLRGGDVDEDTIVKGLAIIERNARSQAQLIADLLDVSRIAVGELRVDRVRVDMPTIVDAAVESFRPAAEARQIRLHSRIDPMVPSVLGDAERVRQIVANLLSNALKFTPNGGEITVRLLSDGVRARLVVDDSGCGIEPDFLPHVFERFRQADASSTRRQGGLGLGLAIVKYLVEEHEGTVAASSDGAGRGATFVVDLPLSPDPVTSPRLTPIDATKAARANLLAGVRVLIVEDDPDGRELLAMALERRGAIVEAAANAVEAFEALARFGPAALVSDIGLPGEDGYSFIARVRRVEAYAKLPALALTAYASHDHEVRAREAGFDRHLAKPVDPSRVATMLGELLDAERT